MSNDEIKERLHLLYAEIDRLERQLTDCETTKYYPSRVTNGYSPITVTTIFQIKAVPKKKGLRLRLVE